MIHFSELPRTLRKASDDLRMAADRIEHLERELILNAHILASHGSMIAAVKSYKLATGSAIGDARRYLDDCLSRDETKESTSTYAAPAWTL